MTTGQFSSTTDELRAIMARLDLHAGDISSCRAVLDAQLKQIADIQAHLDAMLASRTRRREVLHARPARPNGQ